MKIVEHEIVDWEPLRVAVRFGRSIDNQPRLEEFIATWLPRRDDRGVCGCTTKFFDFPRGWNGEVFEFGCEWMCRRCLERLGEELEQQFPSVDRLEIGFDPEPLSPVRHEFIHVAAKRVEFEDGSIVHVEPFEIAKHAVTIGEYEAFSNATGYVTVAEKDPGASNYRDNEMIPTKKGRENFTAHAIGFDDALAYCRWAGARLPTEPQWVAAFLLDEEIVSEKQYLARHNQLSQRPDAPEYVGPEWTATMVGNDAVVVRTGPHMVRQRVVHPPSRFRAVLPRGQVLLATCFRVCKAS